MLRWLSAFCLVLALFGFGPAVQGGQAFSAGGEPSGVMAALLAPLDQGQAQAAERSQRSDIPSGERVPAAQAEGETVVDVTLLFEFVRASLPAPVSGAAPLRFGWTPVASPFIEGPRRPPRVFTQAA